jgi:dihydrofolate reductase
MVHKRKIIVYIATSADGFIARPDGAVDWLDRPRPKGNYGMSAFYKSIDTVLWGRKTCDMALDFQKKGVPGTAFDTRVKNYVFTRGPLPAAAPAGVEFVNQPIKAFASRLREKKGKNIWMMSGAGIIASPEF